MSATEVPIINQPGLVALVDADDATLVSGYRWRSYYRYGGWYVQTSVRSRALLLHRLVMNAPVGLLVDHINGDKLDNRRSNLRLCTNAQNQWNRHVRFGTSPYKGVSWDKKASKWRAAIRFNGRTTNLGSFDDERDAALAYNAAALRLFGEFANPNLVRSA